MSGVLTQTASLERLSLADLLIPGRIHPKFFAFLYAYTVKLMIDNAGAKRTQDELELR